MARIVPSDGGDFANADQLVVAEAGLVALEQIISDERGGGIERGGTGLHRGGEHGGDDQPLQSDRQQVRERKV